MCFARARSMVRRDRPHPDAPLRSSQDSQGCPFRITSYDLEIDGSDFSPEYGVQLHDLRLLEYVGAPESARLLSRSTEYWVEHMGSEKTLSVALQLQHDAGLILSNVQVLQQLVTALHGTSANVMGAVRGHQPFPTHAMRHALPSGRVRRAAHYMTVMGLWAARRSRRGYEDHFRWRCAMLACPAATASRRCLSEPGGEVRLINLNSHR